MDLYERYSVRKCVSEKKREEFCVSNAKLIDRPVLTFEIRSILDSEEFCSKASFCSWPKYIPDKDGDYVKRILKDTPVYHSTNTNDVKGLIRFLVFTDIHLDFGYMEVKYKAHLILG
jgi:hypothetical protein